jgi:hypothetical protein
MGLSSSKQKTTSNQTTNATTTPNVPDYIQGPVSDYYSQIAGLIGQDPYAYTTPANALQLQAGANAANLGGWRQGLGQASDLARNTANAPPRYASPSFATAAQAQGTQAGPAYSGTTYMANPQGYNAVGLGQAQTFGGAQTAAPQTAQAQQATSDWYNPPTLGAANLAGNQGYNAATATASTADPNATQATASLAQPAQQADAQSLLTNFAAYQNPATQALRDTALADFDTNAGQVRAQQAAQAARSGAFGGSRLGIREAQTEGELARARASTDAQLLDRAFTQAVGMSQFDAGNRQQAGLFNAGQANDTSRLNAQLGTQTGLFNAGAQNDRAGLNAQLLTQTGLANAGMQNDASRFTADAANTASQFNAGAQNQYGLAQADLIAQANRDNAAMRSTANLQNAQLGTQASLFNAGAANDVNAQNAGFAQQAGLANQGAQNQFALSQADLIQQANRDAAAAGNNASLQNAQLATQASLANAGAQNDMNRFNAGQGQELSLANMAAANQFGLANQGAANQAEMFNAGLYGDQLQRQLQAAGLIGDNARTAGGGEIADLAAQSQIGQNLWDVQNQYDRAPLNTGLSYGALLNPQLMAQLLGQSVSGTQSGTQVTKSTPSLFDQLMSGGQLAATFLSDRRLKRNIERVGTLEDGLAVYEFDYVWGGRHRGVMADEVATLRPHALGPVVGGFATVNYGAL